MFRESCLFLSRYWSSTHVCPHILYNDTYTLYYYIPHITGPPLLSQVTSTCPGWCGSVDWTWACEPKGLWFNSQSGHIPGFRVRSPVGGTWEATTHWCFSPSLSPFLPLSLKTNKIKKNIKNFFLKRHKHLPKVSYLSNIKYPEHLTNVIKMTGRIY